MEDKIKYNERFEFLKSNTILGPIALFKLSKFKNNIDRARIMYYKIEGDLLDCDFASIEEYEYELRLEAWKNSCIELWMNHHDGLSLAEFAERVMDQQIEREKRIMRRKKVR